MRYAVILLLLLAGCLPGARAVPAAPDALSCAERALRGLGYRIVSRDSDHSFPGALRGEKELPRESYHRVIGEIDVTLRGERDARPLLTVTGRRYEVAGGSAAPPPSLDPRRPGSLEPTVIGRRRGRRTLSPGPVGNDVAAVRSRCGVQERSSSSIAR